MRGTAAERVDEGGRVGGEVAQGVGRRLRVRRRRLAAVAQVVAHHPAAAGGQTLAERVRPGEHRGPAREQDERCVLGTEGLHAQGDLIGLDGGHRSTVTAATGWIGTIGHGSRDRCCHR
jgi:hypothetical protein